MADFALQPFQVFDGDLPAAALEAYQATPDLAIDTETMGLLPWRDRLCLVQLCNGAGQVSVIRINRGRTSAPHLKTLLEAPNIVKIFHFARFDVAMLRYHLGIRCQPIFCTKIASKLARTYSPRHGLKAIVQELEGIDLDKTAQSSDWGNAAALSNQQLEYASNDVRYLIPLRAKLEAMLKREERWPLAEDCFRCLDTLITLDLLHYENVFEH